MNEESSPLAAYAQLHLAVLLWGGTAILGDYIHLAAVPLVWWRVLLTSLLLLPLIRLGTFLRDIPTRQRWIFAGIGVIIAFHWVTFFGAIKLANASVGVVALATTTFFSSFIEPWITGRRFVWGELALGLFILPGVYLIAADIRPEMLPGLFVGLSSAVAVAVFTSLNKRYVTAADPLRITFLEMGAATLVLTPFLPFAGGDFWPSNGDWGWLLLLAAVCTVFTNWLFLRVLRVLSAFAANLTVNLEPVYGVALAYFLLDDGSELGPNFYWGAGMIIVAVFGYGAVRGTLRRRAGSRVQG